MLATIHRPARVEAMLGQEETAAAIADLETRLAAQNAIEPQPSGTEVVGLAEAQARAAIFGRMMTGRASGEEPNAFLAYCEVTKGIDRICGPTADKKGISPMEVYLGMMALTRE